MKPDVDDFALFLDTALTIITEYELWVEGVVPRPVSVVPSPWFDGAKDLVACARPSAVEATTDKPGPEPKAEGS